MRVIQSRDNHARKLVFLLVLLGHCALILMICRADTRRKSASRILHEPLTVFVLNRPYREADAAKEPSPTRPQIVPQHPNAHPSDDLPRPTESDATPSNAITDWYGEAHSVAEAALEKDRINQARRAFEHKMPPAQAPETPSIFDPLPVPRAGTWDGPDRYYVTDNCYYEWDRAPRPPPTLLDNRLKTPVCKPPPKGGGDAMFKALTPDYLKSLPEPKTP